MKFHISKEKNNEFDVFKITMFKLQQHIGGCSLLPWESNKGIIQIKTKLYPQRNLQILIPTTFFRYPHNIHC